MLLELLERRGEAPRIYDLLEPTHVVERGVPLLDQNLRCKLAPHRRHTLVTIQIVERCEKRAAVEQGVRGFVVVARLEPELTKIVQRKHILLCYLEIFREERHGELLVGTKLLDLLLIVDECVKRPALFFQALQLVHHCPALLRQLRITESLLVQARNLLGNFFREVNHLSFVE